MLDLHYSGRIDISRYWAVGDTRTESITTISDGTVGESQPTQDIELIIIGFNHDNLSNSINGINKAAVTVQTKDCLDEAGYMHYVGTINSSNTDGWWGTSNRKAWCNNDFFDALQPGLSTLIKNVSKISNNYTDYDGQYHSMGQSVNTVDKIFLLSEFEIFGTSYVGSEYTTDTDESDGSQYTYMTTSTNRRKYCSTLDDGPGYEYWTRTSWIDNSGNLFYIQVVNTSGDSYNCNENLGIAPAFCL